MKRRLIARLWPLICLLPAIWIFSGCGLCKHVSGTNTSQRETIHVVEHTQLVPVITSIDIPEIKEAVRVKDSTSFLENKYAESTARICADGTLYHDLHTKPQSIQQEQQVIIEYRDSIVVKEKEVEVTVEVPVEKPLNGWQKFRLRGFWVLLGVCAFAYRKQIVWLIKKIIALFA